MTTLCALCRAVDEHFADVRPEYDTHLYVTPSFVVIPAVGPVTPGHVLIVSKQHLPNLASMDTAALGEYKALVERLRQKPCYSNTVCIEAEHGASLVDAGGACITHVHVNFIPGLGEQINLMDGLLSSLP